MLNKFICIFKKVFVLLILYLPISACSNYLLFIENDNYIKYNEFYEKNITTSLGRFKFLSMFNDNISFNNTKQYINKIKTSYLNKFNIVIIIDYPYKLENHLYFDNLFTLINSLYSFLINDKGFTNHLYILGIPQNNNLYQVLIYLKK